MADVKSTGDYYELSDCFWAQFPDTPYMAKYILNDDGYMILITNLKDIYGEKITSTEVQERFTNLNPHAEMKPSIIIKHLKKILKDFESEKMTDSSRVQQCIFHSEVITMELQFTVSQVPFKFEIKAKKLPSDELRTHVVAPSVYLSIKTAHDKKKEDIQDKTLNIGSKVNEIELAKTFMEMQNCATRMILQSRAIEERVLRKNLEKKAPNVPMVNENLAAPNKRDSGGNLKDDIDSLSKSEDDPSSKSEIYLSPKSEKDSAPKSEKDPSKDDENDTASKAENDSLLKTESSPLINTKNSIVNEMQSKQKKKKVFKI